MRQEEEVITISDSDENSVIDIDSDCDMNLLPTFTQSNIQWRNNVGDAEIMPKDWSYTPKNVTCSSQIHRFKADTRMTHKMCCDCINGDCFTNACSCARFNREFNKDQNFVGYMVENGVKSLNPEWLDEFHIFECSLNCPCNKKKCHFSLMNNVGLEQGRDFIVTRSLKTHFMDPKIQLNMWGLNTAREIPKNWLIMEYTGEEIIETNSEILAAKYDMDKTSYMFYTCEDVTDKRVREMRDAEFYIPKSRALKNKDFPINIDAKNTGNLARFANHSCDPNMFCVYVHVENRHPRISRIGIFAKHNIQKK